MEKRGPWRTTPAAERAHLHGIPPAAVQVASERAWSHQECAANCAIGNGFHLPSMMVMFVLLLQGAVGTPACTSRGNTLARGYEYAQHERELRRRIHNTVFDEVFLFATPGLLGAKVFVDEMASLFVNLDEERGFKREPPMGRDFKRLRRCHSSVWAMQVCWAHKARQ